tara:strand:+ start:983 stop:1231 length:249 start_codon:yes stop_codon:yes gene_type:complete
LIKEIKKINMATDYKVVKYSKEEDDGSKTYIKAMDYGDGIFKAHNAKGPALTNKQNEVVEYYLYGVKMSKEEWDRKVKAKVC